ncbi:hypothetical protein EDEG_03656 [Edhazardia aedis USNM 41457]|uniref:AAA+ ATPase domain-containing protein n=1 Tax=Edhazardia aedis (strain USNM 41457) TaxID=1003232 RepID=J9DKG9_EDHAE|nr:hypothetical protein EDEG_03656 [Edhazardia aedis USNM 41457]|eukprot:EJW01882.1 hypothetical protein EDEG_03656 [Edhazardia aedis USNM 41457]
MTADDVLWVEKYRPKNFCDFSFYDNRQLVILKWLNKWNKFSKFLLLCGSPGIGKTSIVYCISNMLNYHIVEYNASENRTIDLLKQIVNLSNSNTLENKKKLILIDEIDNISKDYLFIKEIILKQNIIKCPVVFCCNDFYNTPLRKYKSNLEIVNLFLNDLNIKNILGKVIEKEHLEINEKAINLLIQHSNKDLRHIINNLHVLSLRSRKINEKMILETKILHKNVFKLGEEVFKTNIKYNNRAKHCFNTLSSIYSSGKELLFNIVYENYPKYCKMSSYLPRISTANVLHDILPEEYKFVFLHEYNELCRTFEKIEMSVPNKPSDIKHFLNFYDIDATRIREGLQKKKQKNDLCNFINDKDYELGSYIYQFLLSRHHFKDLETVNHMKQMLPYIDGILDFLPDEILEFINYVKCTNTIQLKFEETREFRYKYHRGVSKSGRIKVGIQDLFKKH